MIQTLQNYLLANYNIKYHDEVKTTFDSIEAGPDTILTAPLEFASDCVWLARWKMPKFLEQVKSQRFNEAGHPNERDIMYYNMVRQWSSQIVKTVRNSWESYDRRPADSLAPGIVTTYITIAAIPCNKPGTIVALCQDNPELGNILKSCQLAMPGRLERERRQYFQNEIKPRALEILPEDDESRQYYLQMAANLLKLKAPY